MAAEAAVVVELRILNRFGHDAGRSVRGQAREAEGAKAPKGEPLAKSVFG